LGQPYAQQPPPKSGCKTPVIIGLIALLLLCGVGGYFAVTGFLGEQREAQAVLENFMRAGERQDVSAGLDLFSANATNEEELTSFFERRELFEGFKEVKIEGFNMSTDTTNGSRATLNGSVVYEDGHDSNMTSTLVGENGKWLIERIDLKQ
jgi:hypothetical protein